MFHLGSCLGNSCSTGSGRTASSRHPLLIVLKADGKVNVSEIAPYDAASVTFFLRFHTKATKKIRKKEDILTVHIRPVLHIKLAQASMV